jgi:plastocyanin
LVTAVILAVAITPAAPSLAAPVFTITLSSSRGPATSDLVIQVSGLPPNQGFDCMMWNPVSTPPPQYIGQTLGRGVAKENGESRFVAAVPNLREQVYLVDCRYKTPGGELVHSKIRLFEITTEFDTPPWPTHSELNYCGKGCSPTSINEFGVFAANIPAAASTDQAMTCAMPLGECTNTSPVGSSDAYGINDLGLVVGVATPRDSSAAEAAQCLLGDVCFWASLCVKSETCPGYAKAVNDSGLIVGQGYACQLSGTSCAWNSLGSNVVASAVSPTGLIVGYAIEPTSFLNNASVCSYKSGACTGGWHDIDTTKGGSSVALGVNDSNLIVGYLAPKGSIAFNGFSCPYNPGLGVCTGRMSKLPSLGGTYGTAAEAVNHYDEIVGSSYVKGNTDYHATEWTGGKAYDLNQQIPANSGWDLQSASAMNNLEQIVGRGLYKGMAAGFFLNPVSPAGPLVSQVAISKTGFSPASTKVIQGGSVQWLNGGTQKPSIADTTGMKLYASKPTSTLGGFVQAFPAAGTYPYADATPGSKLKGTVTVPVETAPASGHTSTTFQVYWANAAAPKGFVYDIQIRRPGKSAFANWLTKQSTTESSFIPSGKGEYSFRARLDEERTGKTSGWSPAASISVS